MKDLKLFLEHRTIDQVIIKCDQTNKEINPEYIIYDEESLTDLIRKYKLNKNQFDNLDIYLVKLIGNKWIAKTKTKYNIDLGRMNDKFLSSDKIDYSYDDIVMLLEDKDMMIIFCKNK